MAETLFKFPRGQTGYPLAGQEKKLSSSEEGALRIYLDGRTVSLDEVQADRAKKNGVEVVVDELNLDPEDRERLVDSLETGLKGGRVRVRVTDGPLSISSPSTSNAEAVRNCL